MDFKEPMNVLNGSNWMNNLPTSLKCSPLIYIAIPGSHNTFTYGLSRCSSVSPDSPKKVRILSHLFKPIVNPVIYAYSKTQGLDIRRQLQIGIRYIDIRIINYNGAIYVAHGLYAGLLIPYLEEVNAFLNMNAGEIVILDFQHFYKFWKEDHEKLVKKLSLVFGCKILNRSCDISRVSITNCQTVNAQVLIVYRNSMGLESPLLWPTSAWPTIWPNKIKVADVIACLNKELERRLPRRGLVSQFLVTVDIQYVMKHLFSSLKSLSSVVNQSLDPWMNNKNPGPKGVNVIICDFVNESFATTVIRLNYKRNDLLPINE